MPSSFFLPVRSLAWRLARFWQQPVLNDLAELRSRIGKVDSLSHESAAELRELQSALDRFQPVFAQLASHISVTNETLNQIGARLDRGDATQNQIGVRLDRSDETLNQIGARLDRGDATQNQIGVRLDRSDETLNQIGARLDRGDATQNQIGERLDRSDETLNQIGARLDRSDETLNQIGARLDRGDATLSQISARLDHGDATLNQIGARLDRGDLAVSQLGLLTAQVTAQVQVLGDGVQRLEALVTRTDALLRLHHDSTPLVQVPSSSSIVTGIGFDFVIPSAEMGLLAYIRRHGVSGMEPGTRTVLARLAKPGSLVIDVGACFGLHAIPLAENVGAAGKVVCFEPSPSMAHALRQTARLNGMDDRIEVAEKAAGDQSGKVQFFLSSHSPMSSLYALKAGDASCIEVDAVSLDGFFPAGTAVGLIKIDAEGAEPIVWSGMQRIIQENADLAVVMEWSLSHFQRAGQNPLRFADHIRSLGYDIGAIDESTARVDWLENAAVAKLEGLNVLLARRSRRGVLGL